jgi:HSP20 family molecular chaperone IbpA
MSALREAMSELPDPVFADLLESESSYLLVVDLPGVTADTLEITAEDGRLQIDARREKPHGPEYRFLREERGLFLDAALPLPPDAIGSKASASIDRGALEVTIPKRASGVGTTIEIDG